MNYKEALRKADYVVFIDESFYNWFGLKKNDSCFCYGAIAIPVEKINDLNIFISSIKSRLTAYWKTDKEIKSSQLYSLPNTSFLTEANKVKYFLQKNNCYLFGYFTSAESFINNKLRDKYFELYGQPISSTIVCIPNELEQLKITILEKWKSTRTDVVLLEDFFPLMINIFSSFFRDVLKKKIVIQYDSRNKREDNILINKANHLLECNEKLNRENNVLAIGTNASNQSAGLCLADFIASDVRRLFLNYRFLLEENSQLEILSALKNPNMEGNIPAYSKRFSSQNWSSLNATTKNLLFPHIMKFFAGNKLSCIAKFGENRLILLDQCKCLDFAD